MKSLLSILSQEEKKSIQKAPMPSFVHPMAAQLTKEYFSDKKWIFETKLDGIRCLLFKKGKKITLKSRNHIIQNEAYPTIVSIAASLDMPDCILDGEMVAFEGKVTSFSQLHKKGGDSVFYYIFDIIYCEGYNITNLPLITRKKVLKECIPFTKNIVYVDYKEEKGLIYYAQACKKGLEGIIAKERNSTYVYKRSPKWLKFKCVNEQEFVIGGYTEPGGARSGFGALMLGYYKDNKLHYAGKVGTGFDEELLKKLYLALKKCETEKNSFINYDDRLYDAHWVEPLLVCQVRFTEWTSSNKLRHPSFLGLRWDKDPHDVIQEK